MEASTAYSLEPTLLTGAQPRVALSPLLSKGSPLHFETMQDFYGPTEFAVASSSSVEWGKLTGVLVASLLLASAIDDVKKAYPLSFVSSEDAEPLQGAYNVRFGELHELAQSEGIAPLKAEAKADFLAFPGHMGFAVRRASLALLDDGSLGATWRNDEWRLSLRFNGDQKIEYVLLDRKNPPEGKTGVSNLEGFKVAGMDVSDLLAT